MKPAVPCLAAALALTALFGQAEARKTLALAETSATPAVRQAAKQSGAEAALDRVAQAVDTQLGVALARTGRFQVLARTDLPALMREQNFGAAAQSDGKAAESLQGLKGADYLLVPVIDDFQNRTETGSFPQADTVVLRSKTRVQVAFNLYAVADGKLLSASSADAEVSDAERLFPGAAYSNTVDDRRFAKAARLCAERGAGAAEAAAFPARVLAKAGNRATVNRGVGNAFPGQIWVVSVKGETLVDPETGEVLGKSGIPVGKVRVQDVLEDYFVGEIIEDFGIEPLQIAVPLPDSER